MSKHVIVVCWVDTGLVIVVEQHEKESNKTENSSMCAVRVLSNIVADCHATRNQVELAGGTEERI